MSGNYTSICLIRKNCQKRLEWKHNKWWLDHLSFRSRRQANDFIKDQLNTVNVEVVRKLESPVKRINIKGNVYV